MSVSSCGSDEGNVAGCGIGEAMVVDMARIQ